MAQKPDRFERMVIKEWEKGAYFGTGVALGVAARWGWMRWVRR